MDDRSRRKLCLRMMPAVGIIVGTLVGITVRVSNSALISGRGTPVSRKDGFGTAHFGCGMIMRMW